MCDAAVKVTTRRVVRLMRDAAAKVRGKEGSPGHQALYAAPFGDEFSDWHASWGRIAHVFALSPLEYADGDDGPHLRDGDNFQHLLELWFNKMSCPPLPPPHPPLPPQYGA